MKMSKVFKSTQEQAIGAWIDYLNQIRIDRLFQTLKAQGKNLEDALESLDEALEIINEQIIGRNRGGSSGMHGFIAEVAECGIGNAREHIIGQVGSHVWVDDNGKTDLLRGLTEIQQKFVNSGGHLSLGAVLEHLEKYPDYLRNGGKYQIPKDHYEKIMYYLSTPEDVAQKIPTSNGEFSLRQWKEVHKFFEKSGVTLEQLEPSHLAYDEVQKETIAQTLGNEEDRLRKINQEQIDNAHQASKATLQEGLQATVVSAAFEGLTEFAIAISKKRKEGKRIREFTVGDWQEIALRSGKGTFRGSVRGASIYALTNFTSTPSAVASAMVTAGFGVAQQIYRMRQGEISESQFIENAEMLCLDASISALSTMIGQAIIPIPILGAIIGNSVGMMVYQFSKEAFKNREIGIIHSYIQDLKELDEKLSDEYKKFVTKLNEEYLNYLDMLEVAFSADIEVAFTGSIQLALSFGVPMEEVLDSHKKVVAYFT